MKKLILIILVSLGLQTQAQTNYCDSIEINLVSSSTWCNLETNISSLGIQGTVTYDWTLVDPTMTWNWAGWDSTSTPNFWLQPNTTTNNVNPTYYNDTLLICLTVMVWDSNGTMLLNCYNSCKDTLFWDGVQWNLSYQQTQIPITCDSITTTYLNITPNSIDVTTNSMSLGVQFPMHSWDLYEGGWNGQLTYSDTNVNASIPLPSPNLIDTFVLCNWSDYGAAPYSCYSCDTFAWNNGNWNLLSMMQQPYFCCDSISYWTDQSQGLTVGLDTSGIVHDADSMEVIWSVCNTSICYSGSGMNAYFPQIMTTDTIKVCYDVWIYEGNNMELCTRCDSLVFDQNTYTWVLFSMNNPTSINELTFNEINDNKIYDMLGRELNEIPVGIMYIRNKRLYITK
tara:strand:- start:24 stop:1211 length:1188 start_codon:yes stop_codon:yes gene_type:complete